MLKSHFRGISHDIFPIKKKYFNPTPGFGRPKPGTTQQHIATAPLDTATYLKVQQWLEDSREYFGLAPPDLEQWAVEELKPPYPSYELFPGCRFPEPVQSLYTWDDYFNVLSWPYYYGYYPYLDYGYYYY